MISKIKTVRFQIVLPEYLKTELIKASENLGVSMSEYIKDALKEKLKHKSN
jgi:metal-responsive CopG/Arc/MetJ family transcriptional regulator